MHPMAKPNTWNRRAKNLLLALGIFVVAGLSTSAWSQNDKANPTSGSRVEPVLVDAIVAVVNTDIITRSDLNRRVEIVMQNIKGKSGTLPPRSELQKQVLEHMIVERAQLHMAKEAGIRVDDLTLDRTIARIAEQNKMSLPDFRKQVERDGIPFLRFREQIRDEIVIKRLREKEVENKVTVNDSEVDNFLATAGASPDQQEIRLGHILVRIPENASPEQIAARSKRAQEVLDKLRGGADFSKTAMTYSDADEALKGGDVGWRSQDRLPQAFNQAIANLKMGDITPIIKSASGFHILKVYDKRLVGQSSAATPSSVELTRARHILIKVNQLVTADEARRKLLELKQRLDNNAAKFEDLAKSFSNDLSANKGGDLGWVHPGDTVPEFERVMNSLKIGQISEPVESPFGFHLIEVLERKTDQVSQERMRMAARQAVRVRKTEEAMEDWLRQVRDSAYVEYRLEEK